MQTIHIFIKICYFFPHSSPAQTPAYLCWDSLIIIRIIYHPTTNPTQKSSFEVTSCSFFDSLVSIGEQLATQFVHCLLKNCSWVIRDFFTSCSQFFHNLLMTCSGILYYLLLTVYDLFMAYLCIVHKFYKTS